MDGEAFSDGRSRAECVAAVRRPIASRAYIALFAAAVCLYLPGVFWGLPQANAPDRVVPFGPDELAPLAPVAELYNVFFAQTRPFNPQYPLFHYFIGAILLLPYLSWAWLTGGLPAPSAVYPFGLADPVHALRVMTVLARMPSVVMGAGCVVLAAAVASRLWDRREGLLAGLLAASLYTMGYYGRTANVDVPALFWIALGLGTCAAALRDGLTVRRAMLLGAFVALAVATKDASYTVFLIPGLAFAWWRWRRQGRTAILAAAGTAGTVYVLACGVLLHPGRYMDHLYYISHGSPTGCISVLRRLQQGTEA